MERSSQPFATYKDIIDTRFLDRDAQQIVQNEKSVPVRTGIDHSLRVKVLDLCGHACTFCHNEGTLVNDAQSNYRVSVFLDTATSAEFRGFQVETIYPDKDFDAEIKLARTQLDIDEIHLTGGEPTQHPKLPELVQLLTEQGLIVKMTSNGESGGRVYSRLAAAGLKGVNFSIFGSTPEEYAETQPSNFGVSWARRKLQLSQESIESAKKMGINVKANCVMRNSTDRERIMRLIARSIEEGFELRILNDLGGDIESVSAIYNLLADLRANPIEIHLLAGVSSTITKFELPNGQVIGFKQIRNLRLNLACDGCGLDQDGKCEEGYYGLRLYKTKIPEINTGEFVMGVCIQRMAIALLTSKFYKTQYPAEIKQLKEREYKMMQALYERKIN